MCRDASWMPGSGEDNIDKAQFLSLADLGVMGTTAAWKVLQGRLQMCFRKRQKEVMSSHWGRHCGFKEVMCELAFQGFEGLG